MVSQTNEQALESAIEKSLVGISAEERKAGVVAQHAAAGYLAGAAADFNRQYALDERFFWQYLQQTHAPELAKLQKHHPADWQRKLLERYDRLIKKHGVLHLLKKGLSVDDAHFNLMFPAPLASSGEKIKQNFAENRFSCTRQVRYSLGNPLQEIDMVLFINGIPFATLELKNAWTGQTARYHGQKQYCEDRDSSQALLTFGRCLVHMAVDTDEVYMTTKLAGKSTFFLPFNKGHHHGQGNPPNPNGHRTAYLWQEIFTRDSVANIIQHFVRLDGSSKDSLAKRTLFFPRYHQLDVVRQLVAHAATYGVGQTYLIQHSAGSGKSNSITWAAYQLIETCPLSAAAAAGKSLEQPLFDSVIVVTDRRLLDKQLRDNIKEFSEVKNIIAPAYKSSELKQALESGKKIIITTIQKFPFIIDGIADLSDKRFAVIIDEAHSSQSGSAHDNMNRAMGKAQVEEAEDAQDKILQAMNSRKMRGNATYLAFTATPKNSTLEKFGQCQQDGTFKPFHLYSMKQAIEEGFILDVLANYTTFRSYYEIEKSIADNPEFDSQKAQKKLRAYVERSQQTIDTKAGIMLEHFVPHIVNAKKLKGKAKGMVVTQNIEVAIRYYKAIQRILQQQGNPFKVLIAFSGSKEVDGIEYTEADINGFAENDTKEAFDSDEYRLLVVANKYLTGFDQPKLCAMYVDKKLTGVLCVQALSRLNRSAPRLGKKTEDLFVLDFFNSVEDVQAAFNPFYTATSLSRATDVNVLHELKDEMDDAGVYEWYEVEDFVARYFNNEDAQTLSPVIDRAAARFASELELEPEQKIDFKVKAKQFVKIYGQMASIMPYEMVAWEKLFWFLKFLIPKLIVEDPDADAFDKLLESVNLSSYGLQRVKLGHGIKLDAAETEVDPQNPNPRGAYGTERETDPLDEIIRNFNERWFHGWRATPEEQKIKFVNMVNSVRNHPDFAAKYQNNPDPHNRQLAFDKMLKEVMLLRRKEELELYKLYANDPAFKASLTQSMQHMLDQGGGMGAQPPAQ
ncbi:type I restriction endonuclease subunit R [Erwinia pyrifoliae]|uniref:type I restriction endonuclease subunit R n=1 Tax=Erwinia pyrifoliae TaxID=79967 RepID=UPI0001961449|nr:type I restriction endonuclease subunit R [Erwinia pyrifoliae]AUX71172.1 type I restriction endonuclease subunit R [Erwinia pyrifoliae]MCA8875114.1 type I restriction endonuclease subunit R [Erwinia pyrifoliae]UXK12203.1 type I restriction endonuclease subunit R [Erwinia pyrifoliae]CAX57308.1 type I restriction-modification system restriction subunit [Erwinia pyrifoliae Ep1/96]CAY76176.1 type I restriction-modification system restriction subunit [Erwinia pyrifoliae DSM 12163]